MRELITFHYNENGQEMSVLVDAFDRPHLGGALIDGEERVIPESRIELLFTYPLERPVRVEAEQEGGFTRRALLAFIGRTYREIYALEEAAASEQPSDPLPLNRGRSNGPYGIWGHGIGDLLLEGVEVQGGGRYEVVVGS